MDADRRRSRRRQVPGVLVAVEAPEVAEELCWAGTAIDINGDGLGISLPPEIRPGEQVLMTFHLASSHFQQVPGVVLRRDEPYQVGAIRFARFSDQDRLSLLDYLLDS